MASNKSRVASRCNTTSESQHRGQPEHADAGKRCCHGGANRSRRLSGGRTTVKRAEASITSSVAFRHGAAGCHTAGEADRRQACGRTRDRSGAGRCHRIRRPSNRLKFIRSDGSHPRKLLQRYGSDNNQRDNQSSRRLPNKQGSLDASSEQEVWCPAPTTPQCASSRLGDLCRSLETSTGRD